MTRTRIDNSDSLAKLVTQCAPFNRKIFNPPIGEIADALLHVKRFSYSNAFLDAVKDTGEVPIEEMLGQLKNTSFPFKEFWVEGPFFLPVHKKNIAMTGPDGRPKRLGLLVRTDKENKSFTFTFVEEIFPTADDFRKLEMIRRANTHGQYDHAVFHCENRASVNCCNEVPVRVSPEGIDIGKADLLERFSKQEAAISPYIDKNPELYEKLNASNLALLNSLHALADFLTRFFVLLGADRFPNNVVAASAEQAVDLKDINKKRMKSGKVPLLPVSPIVIDISQTDRKVFRTGSIKKIRQLLGWTTVRESKPITSKYGRVFTRKEHDRRIPADEDRRNAIREVTAKKPVKLVIDQENARPVLIPSKKGTNGSTPS